MAGATVAAGGGRRTDPRSEATRRALLEAAVDSLRELGLDRSTAREVARRAGCNQAQVFYHYGTLLDLHLAALDEVSARRMATFGPAIRASESLAELVDAARAVLLGDLEAGDLRVLVELVSSAPVVPGLAAEVGARLEPWEALARGTVAEVLASAPLGRLAPADDIAHLVVAAVLGLEMLSSLSADRTQLTRLLDRARALAELLDGEPDPVVDDLAEDTEEPAGEPGDDEARDER